MAARERGEGSAHHNTHLRKALRSDGWSGRSCLVLFRFRASDPNTIFSCGDDPAAEQFGTESVEKVVGDRGLSLGGNVHQTNDSTMWHIPDNRQLPEIFIQGDENSSFGMCLTQDGFISRIFGPIA